MRSSAEVCSALQTVHRTDRFAETSPASNDQVESFGKTRGSVRLRSSNSLDRLGRAQAAPPALRHSQGAQGQPRWTVPEGPRCRVQRLLSDGWRDSVFDTGDVRLFKMSQNLTGQCGPVSVEQRSQSAGGSDIDATCNDCSSSDKISRDPLRGSLCRIGNSNGGPIFRFPQNQIVLVESGAHDSERQDAFRGQA